MTIEQFNLLDEQSKRVIIFNADKLAERVDDFTKSESDVRFCRVAALRWPQGC